MLKLEYGDEAKKTADHIARAVKVDDEFFIRTRTKGSTLIAETDYREPMALLHTLDDYLACLIAAEGSLKASRKRKPESTRGG